MSKVSEKTLKKRRLAQYREAFKKKDQYGTKESTASKAYSTVLKNYNSLIRTLLSCMPQKTSDDVDDGFEAFVGTLKK